jgi:alpha-L-fucosidase 2
MKNLWYKKPAVFWEEALPLGNGRIGAMVYGGVQKERIELNEDSLWSGRPSEVNPYGIPENIDEVRQLLREKKFTEATLHTNDMLGGHLVQAYQPAGTLSLDFNSKSSAQDYHRALDLNNGIATTSYRQNGVAYKRESFTSFPHQVMAMRLSSNKPGSLTFNLCADSELRHEIHIEQDNLTLTGTCPAKNHGGKKSMRWEVDGRTGMQHITKTQVLITGGTLTAHANKLKVSDADEVILLTALETGFTAWNQEPSDDLVAMQEACDKRLSTASQAGWALLKKEHCADFSSLYGRVQLDLKAEDERPTDEILKQGGDKTEKTALVNLLFNYGRYLLISSSRTGSKPANLQGVWSNKLLPIWRSDYHININLQMNYWPAETCNLADCAKPMLEYIADMAVSGEQAAKTIYDARGWCAHHASDIWCYTQTAASCPQISFWPMGGAWLCQHLWEHFAFNGDKAFLKKALPILKGCALFFVDFLVKGSNGELITSPSTSPENAFIDPETGETASVCEGSAMDQILIRELFTNVLEGCILLDDKDELTKDIEATMKKLAMPKIAKDGRLLEFGIEVSEIEPTHRHLSHLYGVYPGWMFTPSENQKYYEASRKSLDIRSEKSTGWGMAWRVALWARFRDGNKSLNVINNLLRFIPSDEEVSNEEGGGLYTNLWDGHPPFQIDGNFGVTAGIAEMLLQSHQKTENGVIILDILPALPECWTDGSISGLRARGCLTISFKWAGSKVYDLSIKAKQKLSIKLIYNDKDEMVTLDAAETKKWH